MKLQILSKKQKNKKQYFPVSLQFQFFPRTWSSTKIKLRVSKIWQKKTKFFPGMLASKHLFDYFTIVTFFALPLVAPVRNLFITGTLSI